MTRTSISAKIDARDKQEFIAFCDEVGLSPSQAINLFIKFVVREHYIPSVLTSLYDPFYEEENLNHVKKAIDQLKAGKGTAHELIEDDK